ncbi:hypothetical protein DK842_19335 [Chromobacterium phragmitis]|uniref:Uncharacterized protein n=2 Tax=Chromobacterium phragmitis TaxID=2202141 RepID=A0A344UD93_9NEIS|nr:hypothetical protein [Chromobacterium phragmitis]AXE31860.1 hypothetical protein DK842_19335 [Chromobacterium phragmitis]AXE33241.1 hypothetical protein DK843_02265 [Chromobacterium phragmitis]
MSMQGYAVLYSALVIALFAAVVWKTDLLRDRGTLASGVASGQQTYSLARSQLIWWTFLVAIISGWLLLTTNNLPAPTAEVLGLLGISVATSGAASLIDAPSGASPGPLRHSRGWAQDVLDDGQGISVHRYQALLANAGIGIAFLYKSVQQQGFYQIDASWLAVLGLSSAMYVGMKSREPAIPAAAAPAISASPQASPAVNTPPQAAQA